MGVQRNAQPDSHRAGANGSARKCHKELQTHKLGRDLRGPKGTSREPCTEVNPVSLLSTLSVGWLCCTTESIHSFLGVSEWPRSWVWAWGFPPLCPWGVYSSKGIVLYFTSASEKRLMWPVLCTHSPSPTRVYTSITKMAFVIYTWKNFHSSWNQSQTDGTF